VKPTVLAEARDVAVVVHGISYRGLALSSDFIVHTNCFKQWQTDLFLPVGDVIAGDLI